MAKNINPRLEADVAYLQGIVKAAAAKPLDEVKNPQMRKVAEAAQRDAHNAYCLGFSDAAADAGLTIEETKIAFEILQRRAAEG